ncbi:hypothetical protein ACA910_018055 [Epithemia clementina (nom. ined.)]
MVEPVDAITIRSSGNAVASCIWSLSDIANYMNAGAVFVKQLLKGLGCNDNDLSPFAKQKWENLTVASKSFTIYSVNTVQIQAITTMTTFLLLQLPIPWIFVKLPWLMKKR